LVLLSLLATRSSLEASALPPRLGLAAEEHGRTALHVDRLGEAVTVAVTGELRDALPAEALLAGERDPRHQAAGVLERLPRSFVDVRHAAAEVP
jgi:hypothetical protein